MPSTIFILRSGSQPTGLNQVYFLLSTVGNHEKYISRLLLGCICMWGRSEIGYSVFDVGADGRDLNNLY